MLNLRPGLYCAAVILTACLLVAATAAAQPVTMKIGHATTKGAYDNWADTFKAGLAERVGDRIKVEVYPLSQLGAIPAMVQGVQLGTIEMTMTPPAFLSGVDPRYAVLSAPGIFDDLMHGFRTVHDPAFKKAFWSIGDAKGLKLVSLTCDAPTDYATSTPIRKLSDFKGRKLRVFGSKLEIEALRRLGAAGVPMPLSEVVPAIQQKTIDGNKAGITIFVPFKYQRIAKYVLKSRESLICSGRFVSKVWFDKLAPDLQKAILDQALGHGSAQPGMDPQIRRADVPGLGQERRRAGGAAARGSCGVAAASVHRGRRRVEGPSGGARDLPRHEGGGPSGRGAG